MKLHDFPGAPNCRRVTIYLAEKGLDVPLERVDLLSGEHRAPPFRRKNPAGRVPVLELDDGVCLSESLAIVEYLEELNPEPPMIGTTPLERARVRAAERRAELGIMFPAAIVFQNTSPFFAARVDQSPETAAYGRRNFGIACKLIDELIGDGPFFAGDRPTIADCTLAAAVEFASRAGLEIDSALGNFKRWWTAFSARPSLARE